MLLSCHDWDIHLVVLSGISVICSENHEAGGGGETFYFYIAFRPTVRPNHRALPATFTRFITQGLE
jgi:hypothetical protein